MKVVINENKFGLRKNQKYDLKHDNECVIFVTEGKRKAIKITLDMLGKVKLKNASEFDYAM